MFAQVNDEDYEWLNRYRWRLSRKQHTNYAITTIEGKVVKMHRLILGLTDPKILGEHADHDGLNCQRYNLRPCTHTQNMMNKTSQKGSTSKYLGVNLSRVEDKNRGYINKYWRADIRVEGKIKFLGYFPPTAEGEKCAALARNEAAIKYHGEFANLNIV